MPRVAVSIAHRLSRAEAKRRIETLPEDECTDPAAYGSVGAELDTVATIVKGA